MIAAARIVPIELGLDPGRDDLDLQAFVFRRVVPSHEPVQPENGLGAFDHELGRG